MLWQHISLLVLMHASTAQLLVEMRNSEVWLIRGGQERQLTHDGKAKLQTILSPAQNRVAYYEECPVAEHCKPAVVILDLEGHRIVSFEPKLQAVHPTETCASILSIVWVGSHAIGAECHINPSLSEYIETDISTGQTTKNLLGFGFVPSPDDRDVAHVGWIPHFAPPFATSHYLQINSTTVYPLPKETGPVEQKDLSGPPKVFQEHGLTYSGIHEFASPFSWSPDSQRVALIDCTYDWTADSPMASSAGERKESNRRCSLSVVSRKGEASLLTLTDVSSNDSGPPRIFWTSPHQLTIRAHDVIKTLNVP